MRVKRCMVEGAPLPPSFARFASLGWSPLPADAGRDEKRLRLVSTRVRKEHESAQANYQKCAAASTHTVGP
jgi:hypothetical protein